MINTLQCAMPENDVEESCASAADHSHEQLQEITEQLAKITEQLKQEKEKNGTYKN